MDNIKTDRIPAKIKWKYMPLLYCVSSFEDTIIKICKTEPPDLLFLVFNSFYASIADIIFHKFLELHSELSVKKYLSQIFFFNRFTQTPHPPPQRPKFAKRDVIFLSMLKNVEKNMENKKNLANLNLAN